MRKTKSIAYALLLTILPVKALAVCPVCAIGVAAGLGLAEVLGIDDTITGLWIGALIVAFIYLTVNWLVKKKWKFKGDTLTVTILYYASIIIPLYYIGDIGHANHKLWGIDKLLLGMGLGSISFWGFALWYQTIKRKNNGRALFPFQKVIMPISPLAILSIVFYFITKGAV